MKRNAVLTITLATIFSNAMVLLFFIDDNFPELFTTLASVLFVVAWGAQSWVFGYAKKNKYIVFISIYFAVSLSAFLLIQFMIFILLEPVFFILMLLNLFVHFPLRGLLIFIPPDLHTFFTAAYMILFMGMNYILFYVSKYRSEKQKEKECIERE